MSEEDPAPRAARHGSAVEAVGHEVMSAAVDIPWDDYLGAGATARIADGSLGLVRHAYPAEAARSMRAAATPTGHLTGDAADQERLAAIGVGIAAAHHRPARMPHRPGEEPHAWWIAEERTLVWLPWADIDEPAYGLELLERGEASAVVVLAPEAVWTVHLTGIPPRGAAGNWPELPERLQAAVLARVRAVPEGLRWERAGDTVTLRWIVSGEVRRMQIAVNRSRPDAYR